MEKTAFLTPHKIKKIDTDNQFYHLEWWKASDEPFK